MSGGLKVCCTGGHTNCYSKGFDGFRVEDDGVRALVSATRSFPFLHLSCYADGMASPYRLEVVFEEPPESFTVEERFGDDVTEKTVYMEALQ